MGRKKIYDTEHQGNAIRNWKRYGLICREGETYQDIYSFVMNIENCNLCKCNFTEKNRRCMDHDHKTGYFRQVLCHKCNSGFDLELNEKNKTGHRWITPCINKNGSKISVSFRYNRGGFKRKASQSLTKLIALSFIHLLKKPI
jgi:hypothetical protein